MNKKAAFSLDDKYSKEHGRILLSGVQALVRLPLDQARLDQSRKLKTAGFISGYRGSPLGGLDKALWQAETLLKKYQVQFRPGINEDLAATSVWGSQQANLFPEARYDGVFGLWYGKGPGVDRSGDVFKHANAAGVSKFGGVLAVAGDDHACKSSTLPHQSDYAFIDAMMPVLFPSDIQEVLDFGLYGWALSRYCGLWVGMKMLADIADSSMVADIDPARILFHYPAFLGEQDVEIRWPDSPKDQEIRLHQKRLKAAQHFIRCNHLDRTVIESDNPSFGIVVSGKAWPDTRQALNNLGITENKLAQMGVRVYKPAMIWPLEPERLKLFASGLKAILVIEEKRPLIETQIKEILYDTKLKPLVSGKKGPDEEDWLSIAGDLNAASIAEVLARWFSFNSASIHCETSLNTNGDGGTSDTGSIRSTVKLFTPGKPGLQRKPHFCSGCPHNTSTLIPEGSRAGGGIGCHYMATWMDRGTETFTQMGGEGTQWIGQAPFTETDHIFQNLGDGTYYHSGVLAIRAAVAAKVNITYKILYNDAVAMTGGQAVDGALSVEQLTRQLAAEGVKHQVIISEKPERFSRLRNKIYHPLTPLNKLADGVSVYSRKYFLPIEEKLREKKGVSVLIYDQVCAAEKRRRLKENRLHEKSIKVLIQTDVCDGCGDCNLRSNCLSVVPVETEKGRKRSIDQSACNKDLSCVDGFCPSFITVTKKRPGLFSRFFNNTIDARDKPLYHIRQNRIKLPEPEVASCRIPWNIIIAGVGGTGVVTIGALLAVAAFLEKKGVYTLDQTGLAQKFGAVTTHIRIANRQQDIHGKIPVQSCNLLLGMDMLVAASDDVIPYLSGIKTHAVVNSSESMPADFIKDRNLNFPLQSIRTKLYSVTQDRKLFWLKAGELSEKFTGDSIGFNLLMLGFCAQMGLLPVKIASLEHAITLNGVAVEKNLRILFEGRKIAYEQMAAKKQSVKYISPEHVVPVKRSLSQLIDGNVRALTEYKDARLASEYLQLLNQVRSVEKKISPTERLTETVARNYSKILIIKDEYEVARLFRSDRFLEKVKQKYPGSAIHFYMSPPLLSGLFKVDGKPVKIKLGSWIWPVLGLLAKLRKIRGKWWDPFYFSTENVLQRKIRQAYERDLIAILGQVTENNYQHALELARWPEEVRGFGYVREQAFENIQQLRAGELKNIREVQAKYIRRKLAHCA